MSAYKINKDDWENWSHKVLGDLDELNKNYKELREELSNVKTDIAVLKVKAALWIGGASLTFTVVVNVAARVLL